MSESSQLLSSLTAEEGHAKPKEERVGKVRWVVLSVFALVAFTQCIIWFTFGCSSPSFFETFFTISRSDLDLLLNYGPIFFIPVAPFISWLLSKHGGLRKTVLLGAVLICVGAIIRIPPCLVHPDQRHKYSFFLHIGQALNAAAGPVTMNPVSLLSAIWFNPNERTTATALAFLSATFGLAIGFLVGPLIVSSIETVPLLIYFQSGLGIISLLCTIFFFPSDRKRLQETMSDNNNFQQQQSNNIQINSLETPINSSPLLSNNNNNTFEQINFLKGVLICLKSPSVIFAVLASGIQSGIFSAWNGIFQQILEPLGYSASQAGWFGFASTCSAVVGSALIGKFIDKWFPKRMKLVLIIVWIICLTNFLWWTFSLPSPIWTKPLIPSITFTIGLSVTLGGLFQGMISPVLYELAAEASFPVSESTSTSLITFIWNVAALIMLFVAPKIPVIVYNLILIGSFGFCFVLTIFMKENYRRKDFIASLSTSASQTTQLPSILQM